MPTSVKTNIFVHKPVMSPTQRPVTSAECVQNTLDALAYIVFLQGNPKRPV